MTDFPVETGRVVQSIAGRDKGRCFVIVEVLDSQYVMVVDGSYHRVDHPKKKKLRHLRLRPQVLQGVRAELLEGRRLYDGQVRKEFSEAGLSGVQLQ